MAADTPLHLTTPADLPAVDVGSDSPNNGGRHRHLVANTILFINAWGRLALYDFLALFGYKRLHAFTRTRRIAGRAPTSDTVARVCAIVKEACVWYPKRSYCLQRSSVTTWMLRRRGVAANLIIGYRPVPIDSHAWVEVEGVVVNDRPQYQKFYQVLDRL